jgi:hypothetical protein
VLLFTATRTSKLMDWETFDDALLLPYLTIISVSCEDTEENYESAVL